MSFFGGGGWGPFYIAAPPEPKTRNKLTFIAFIAMFLKCDASGKKLSSLRHLHAAQSGSLSRFQNKLGLLLSLPFHGPGNTLGGGAHPHQVENLHQLFERQITYSGVYKTAAIKRIEGEGETSGAEGKPELTWVI